MVNFDRPRRPIRGSGMRGLSALPENSLLRQDPRVAQSLQSKETPVGEDSKKKAKEIDLRLGSEWINDLSRVYLRLRELVHNARRSNPYMIPGMRVDKEALRMMGVTDPVADLRAALKVCEPRFIDYGTRYVDGKKMIDPEDQRWYEQQLTQVQRELNRARELLRQDPIEVPGAAQQPK